MESTLALTLSDLQVEVAFLLGFSRSTSAWTDEEAAVVSSCIRSGLRQFYVPPILPGMVASHEWSFLRPSWTLVILQGALASQLPDDFGTLDGPIYYAGTDSALPTALPITGEGHIIERRALLPEATGRPTMAAIRPKKGTAQEHGQRFELVLWPTPERDYTINLTYSILPDALTDSRPYPYGGMQHAETILESCLSYAEQRVDDSAGVHKAAFMERLAASVSADRRLKPAFVGYNSDRSDRRGLTPAERHGWSPVTVYGVQP